MATEIFDDGSRIETDGAGRVVSVTDSAGAIVRPDTSILGDFARNVLGGAGVAVRDYLRGVSGPTTPAPVAAAPRAPAWLPIAVIGGALYLFLKPKSE